jgi:CRISPR system Cascade subunit CasB
MLTENKSEPGTAFVNAVVGKVHCDTGFGATLRRADNPATEYQAWEYLSVWCDLEKPWRRLPFACIGAALARAKPQTDGHLGIGQAIAQCYEDRSADDPAKARFRRLLACDSVEEACRHLRSTLQLIASRGVPLCYAQLLNELLNFSEFTRRKWATNFYRKELADVSLDVHASAQ